MVLIYSKFIYSTYESHGRRKDFFQGGVSRGFSQSFFQWGGKSGEIWFLPVEIEKQHFFHIISTSRVGQGPPLPTPMAKVTNSYSLQ